MRIFLDANILFSAANHDLYINPVNGRVAPVPRHAEIKNTLAQAIRKQLGLE
jgi:mRNA interferase HicA